MLSRSRSKTIVTFLMIFIYLVRRELETECWSHWLFNSAMLYFYCFDFFLWQELNVKVVRNIQINRRYEDFKKNFTFDQEKKRIIPLESKCKPPADIHGSIVFAYATDGLKLAACLSQIIHDDFPNIKTSLLTFNQAEIRKEIDNADIIVIFVSDEFLQAQHHVEELHIALCRQRTITESTVVYLVQVSCWS